MFQGDTYTSSVEEQYALSGQFKKYSAEAQSLRNKMLSLNKSSLRNDLPDEFKPDVEKLSQDIEQLAEDAHEAAKLYTPSGGEAQLDLSLVNSKENDLRTRLEALTNKLNSLMIDLEDERESPSESESSESKIMPLTRKDMKKLEPGNIIVFNDSTQVVSARIEDKGGRDSDPSFKIRISYREGSGLYHYHMSVNDFWKKYGDDVKGYVRDMNDLRY